MVKVCLISETELIAFFKEVHKQKQDLTLFGIGYKAVKLMGM
jgi:hypothetical protein